MKLVREHINEKFTEDSDSVADMGIGMEAKVEKFRKEHVPKSENISIEVLTSACLLNRLDIIEYLIINNPLLINKHDSMGETPLTWAIFKKHIDVVKYLLENGADPELPNLATNTTPMRTALESFKPDQNIINLLNTYISKNKK
jgi:ankyrin repeat protein